MASPSGLDRLINLSDAVVAIAVTLLVLPLVDTATAIGTSSVGDLLSDNGSEIFAFVLSFAVISRFWLFHHAMYLHVADYNTALVWANFLWLLSIVFLPFPTELVATGGVNGVATSALYIGTMVVTSGALLLAQWIIVATPALQAEGVRGKLTVGPAAVSAVTMLVALVIAVSVPSVGLWALLLLVPMGFSHRLAPLWHRKSPRPSA